ncbi:MAG: PAS domain S-box protein [Acidimicrobiia bacterium]
MRGHTDSETSLSEPKLDSDRHFHAVFESAASGMALVSPTDGRFLKMNAAGCEMLGYSEDELQGRTIMEVVAPDDREDSMTRFRQVVTGELDSAKAKLHYLRKDGSTAYGLISTALVRDPDGQPLHLVANVVDITEQVEAQDELRVMLDSKDQLIASVSHELRTPLTAVLGFAQLMRSELPSLSPGEQVEIVKSIADQTADLTNIVEDLLVAARADNETLKVAEVSVDLRAQSAQVLEALGGNEDGHEIELTGPTIRAMGDPARVRQVLRNLISNAFRYGGDNIEVRTYDCGTTACVAVIDDGQGIPLGDRESIFQPYHRASNSEELTASIGLGLTVSRKLASLMRGELNYSYEDGKSVFELSLPLSG